MALGRGYFGPLCMHWSKDATSASWVLTIHTGRAAWMYDNATVHVGGSRYDRTKHKTYTTTNWQDKKNTSRAQRKIKCVLWYDTHTTSSMRSDELSWRYTNIILIDTINQKHNFTTHWQLVCLSTAPTQQPTNFFHPHNTVQIDLLSVAVVLRYFQ